MSVKYRVVRDEHFYDYYQAQCRHWWFPVWINLGYAKSSIAEAEDICVRHAEDKKKPRVVKVVHPLRAPDPSTLEPYRPGL